MYNYLNWSSAQPDELKLDDAIALKVVAVAGGGNKVSKQAAEALFPQFPNAGWMYRG